MKNPYMPLWVTDYVRGTRLFTLEQKGLYMDILLELWLEGDLPDDISVLAKTFGVNPRTFKKIWTVIQVKFEVNSGRITHERICKERLKMINKSEKNALNGKKGGLAKANAKQTLKRTPSNTDSDLNPNLDIDNINSTVTDLHFPESKTKQKSEISETSEATRLASLVNQKYKSLQMPHEVLPYIINLLNDVDAKTLETAIIKASELSSNDHKFRPNFQKKFPNAEAVKNIAKYEIPPEEIPF